MSGTNGPERPGPERPGPEYPPEWDQEPTEVRGCRGWEWGLCNGIGCDECNGGAA